MEAYAACVYVDGTEQEGLVNIPDSDRPDFGNLVRRLPTLWQEGQALSGRPQMVKASFTVADAKGNVIQVNIKYSTGEPEPEEAGRHGNCEVRDNRGHPLDGAGPY